MYGKSAIFCKTYRRRSSSLRRSNGRWAAPLASAAVSDSIMASAQLSATIPRLACRSEKGPDVNSLAIAKRIVRVIFSRSSLCSIFTTFLPQERGASFALREIDDLFRNGSLSLAADLELHLNCTQDFTGLRSDSIRPVWHDILLLQVDQRLPKNILEAISRQRPNDGYGLGRGPP